MNFDPLFQPYTSNRYPITARNGMVITGNQLASSAGLSILQQGGNAIDAAIATAATLTVVEPTANGLGSDAFAIVWVKDKLYGLNASGYAPSKISIKELQKQGYTKMPTHGWIPVTVPGAIGGWVELHKRFGKLPFHKVLAPAIAYAENGYPLAAKTSEMWERSVSIYKEKFADNPKYNEWFKTFTKDNDSYHFGDIVTLPNHAKSLKLIAESYGKAFYEGEIADALVRQSKKDGGYFTKEDLVNYQPSWVEPIKVNYHGVDVYEIPPNGQGLVALMALNILDKFSFEYRDSKTFHHQIEAIKMAFADGKKYISDPRSMDINLEYVLSDSYGKTRANIINDIASTPEPLDLPKSGTVYLCTADSEGNMVSFIQSNYMGFGSGIVVEDYGISLQNRGADFSFDESHVNALAPNKKTYHTIIPGFMMKDGKPIGPFGVMGGYMQPQGHVQVVMNYIDFMLNPQMCIDAPRWQWLEGKKVIVEPNFENSIVHQLVKKGHLIEISKDRNSFGRGEMIIRLDNGVYVGGCESRTDANIACY